MTGGYCTAGGLLGIVVAALVGFVVGYLVRYLTDRAKENRMNNTPTSSRWRDVYETIAPALVVFCIVCSMFASVGVFFQSRVNAQQDARRTADNTRFIKCFDDFATDLSGSLPPVRKATQRRDAAQSAAFLGAGGLEGLLVKIVKRTAKVEDFTELAAAFERLRDADALLIAARNANPYPAPPSKFCDLP